MTTKRGFGAAGYRMALAYCVLMLWLALLAGCAFYSRARPEGNLLFAQDLALGETPAVTLGRRVAAGDVGFEGVPVRLGGAYAMGAEHGAPPALAKGVTIVDATAPPPAAMAPVAAPPTISVPAGGEAEPPPVPVDLSAMKRLVIYTANFSILVSSVQESMKALLEKIEEWDGYVQTADLQRVAFRVPVANFDRAVEEISKIGVVRNKQIRAEDVTSQYRDLQLRLEVAEASRKRMMAILEKADKMKDVIEIEKEIRRLTQEIEQMKAQLRTMADQILYSTITVELSAKAPQVKRPRPRRGSYFSWINQIGAENIVNRF